MELLKLNCCLLLPPVSVCFLWVLQYPSTAPKHAQVNRKYQHLQYANCVAICSLCFTVKRHFLSFLTPPG